MQRKYIIALVYSNIDLEEVNTGLLKFQQERPDLHWTKLDDKS